MDRTQAFTEYAHILNDMEDWLEEGFRQAHDDMPAPVLPPLATSEEVNLVQEDVTDSAIPARMEPELNHDTDQPSASPGIGFPGATLMIVTPPPADGDSSTSHPLPSSEAEYLGKWLTALELNVEKDVFVTPAVKCRTPGGGTPNVQGYLRDQFETVKPRALLILGSSACGSLTGSDTDFASLVTRDWSWGGVPAMVLWTPAEVLANPGRLRAPVWNALQRLKAAWNALPATGV